MTAHMKPVSGSSSISHIGHDPATNVLSVQFHGGETYHYAGVNADQAAAFHGAKSVGRHFIDHIKGTFKQVKK